MRFRRDDSIRKNLENVVLENRNLLAGITFVSNSGTVTIEGRGNGGNDTLNGGSGSDFPAGGMGDDAIFGNEGNDGLRGGDDTIYGQTLRKISRASGA